MDELRFDGRWRWLARRRPSQVSPLPLRARAHTMAHMAGIDLSAAQARLDAYLAAELAVLGGQEYEISGRRLKRADLVEIRSGVQYWNRQVQAMSAGRRRAIVPRPSF